MIPEKFEDLWDGKVNGLYGEVVTEDSYHLRQLKFVPEVIYDLGMNVGIFTRFARELFPKALIIAVEPDAENIAIMFKFSPDMEDIVVHHAALGKGRVYKCIGAVNGAHEVYLTDGPGYPENSMREDCRLELTDIESTMLDRVIGQFPSLGMKTLLKLDIEGNETVIFDDPKSMAALKSIDFIAGEFHNFALTTELLQPVKEITERGMKELAETHDIEMNHIYFFATKKVLN